jgi:D-serine dehydratase
MKRSGISVKEYESRSNKMLNDARKKANEDSFASLKDDNAIKLMITAASKGKPNWLAKF